MTTLLSTVLTSALVASVVGPVINAWIESRKARSGTRLEALTAAIALEGYAIACADHIAKHETAASSDGHAGSYIATLPSLPEPIVVAGFRQPRRAAVADRLLMLPQTIQQADQDLAFWWDVVGDHAAAGHAALRHTARIGLDSLALAADIRAAFALPSRRLTFGDYDVQHTLESAVESPTNTLERGPVKHAPLLRDDNTGAAV
jgi:hypothetical protein